jgi:hypothetical protein
VSVPDTELIRSVAPQERAANELRDATWWERLRRALGSHTPTALRVLNDDADMIASAIAPRCGDDPDVARWGSTRVRTGIVVGSVQSGKTANMLAVAAKALDRGVDIIVILAGTRIALWLQTYERALQQLDGSSAETAYRRDRVRVLVPSPNDVLGETSRADARQYIGAHRRRIADAARTRLPMIIIVPKEDDHLSELARVLHNALSPAVLADRGRPVELVVMDDEADDGSVLTAEDADKVTPSFIRHLWSDNREPDRTFHKSLLATYVAYTATPHANFLQDTHNPLCPRDFQFALRVPDDRGSVDTRELSFLEPAGLPRFYTGGRSFYERGTDGACVLLDQPVRSAFATDSDFAAAVDHFYWDTLGDALRAYLVAAAVRLCVTQKRLSSVKEWSGPIEQLRTLIPQPHSMLINPSALRDLHFEVAHDVFAWSTGATAKNTQPPEDRVPAQLDAAGLLRRLTTEEQLWREWLESYQATSRTIETIPGAEEGAVARLTWSTVRATLEKEVFPHVALRVLNSHEDASERPRFAPVPNRDGPGQFSPPPDLLSVFVAGNVLSRGLTLEGLTTSLFVRSSRVPAADTQMQMQRWFGYRGQYLSLCRVFLHRDQHQLFRDYHANDEALKSELLRRNGSAALSPTDPFVVLAGTHFVATTKVDVRKVPLHPGPTPSVPLVEHDNSALADANLGIVTKLLARPGWMDLIVDGDCRGLILKQPLGMTEVADILDEFRYSHHAPTPDASLYARWRSLEVTWKLPSLLKLPPGATGVTDAEPAKCPYSIAAYLRLWTALLANRDARAFYPTDKPSTRWNLLNLKDYQSTRPQFYVGIKFGEAGPAIDPTLRDAGVRAMTRRFAGSRVNVLWGSRGTRGDYLGDQLFDYHFHKSTPVPRLHDDQAWRPRGHPGLLLFHLVRHETKNIDMVALGLALPHGGPDHIAALR